MLEAELKTKKAKYKKEYAQILKTIKKYDRIVVFRHIMPDFDCLGTQMGLVTWLKDNFPNKEISYVGDNHVVFTPRLFPEMMSKNDAYFSEKPFLAIIVDVGNTTRIADPRFQKASEIIVLDHHPKSESLANIEIIDTTCGAAAELVASMCFSYNLTMSKEAARNFYIGIVGDTGSFKYSSTSPHTMTIAAKLLRTGIKTNEIVNEMFLKKVDDLYVTAYILNHFEISPDGIAYYVLSNKIQEELKITTERGKENVNLFANIEGINAWCSITEDPNPKDPCYRVSIRSKLKPINEVAKMFEGGGHAQASGAKLKTIDDLPRLIEELGKLFR